MPDELDLAFSVNALVGRKRHGFHAAVVVQWLQRVHAVLFHHGVPVQPGRLARLEARSVHEQLAELQLPRSCLPSYLSPPTLAHDVAFSWHALSRATHHHLYELDHVREELDSLITTICKLIATVSALAAARPTVNAPSR